MSSRARTVLLLVAAAWTIITCIKYVLYAPEHASVKTWVTHGETATKNVDALSRAELQQERSRLLKELETGNKAHSTTQRFTLVEQRLHNIHTPNTQ